ncbi:MAG: tetratricopeptide repeat protein [Lewinellaceae bacterium]|nr:tetratricopeptide repeat protein [Saprospiraceae bacterium]MCB9330788.1 tetratricopeptide repeat protein [Lewinellaceae bacterium]
MELIQTLQGLKELIRKSETEEALAELASFIENIDADLLDEVYALQQQMSLCQQNIRLNLIDHKEYSITFSNISFSTLRLITVANKKLQNQQQSSVPSAGFSVDDHPAPTSAGQAPAGPDAELLQAGYQKMQQEDYTGALNDFTAFHEKNPESWEVKQHFATLYEQLGLWEEAMHWYSETIRQNPKQALAFNNRGNIYLEQLEDYGKAYKDFNAAVVADPNLTAAQFNRALAAMHLGEYPQAIADLTVCIDSNFERAMATGLRGICRVQTANYSDAETDLKVALSADPSNASYWGSHGLCRYHLGAYPEAVELMTKALELDPSQLEIQTVRGIAYYFLENYDAAEADFEWVVQQNPDYGYAWFYLGLVHKVRGAYEPAVDCLVKSYTLEPDLADAYAIMGVIAFEQEQYVEAIQFCERALQSEPENETAREFLEKAHAAKNNSGGLFGKLFGG